MGGVCIKEVTVRDSPSGRLGAGDGNGQRLSSAVGFHKSKFSSKKTGPDREHLQGPFAFSDGNILPVYGKRQQLYDSGELRLSELGKLKPATATRTGANKVSGVSSLLGRAGTIGLGKAVEVLDTVGSSMTNLNPSSGFVSGIASKGNKISIRAFEVANTIAKGANLFNSLSEESIKFLKEEVLHSDGVQRLVSTDMAELLRIAAADKREEFDMFSREVARFGNLCKDPQWHNLGRYFEILGSDLTPQKQLKEEAETIMQELMSLAQHTSELYHEFHALDRFEQDYRRKLQEEESLHATQRGESLTILRNELKRQRKLVWSLKKTSLWSKSLEEVMGKFVDIIHFIHQEILKVFGVAGINPISVGLVNNPQSLGSAGLALHYANIINQIDTVVARPSYIPPSTRDTLYQGLPPGVKAALRSRLQSFNDKEELTVPQIKAEMEKSLEWIVPIASNTTKTEFSKKPARENNPLRIQTLHHAQKEKTEENILELVTWLHHLVSQVKYQGHGFKSIATSRAQLHQDLTVLSAANQLPPSTACDSKTSLPCQLSQEDRVMLEDVGSRNPGPVVSKSQEFKTAKQSRKEWKLSKSSGHSPSMEFSLGVHLVSERIRALDILDGVDTLGTLAC